MRIGIDLGGTNIVAALVDDGYHIIEKIKRPTLPSRPSGEIIGDVAEMCALLTENNNSCPDFIGIGIPGSVDREKGKVLFTANVNLSGAALSNMLGFNCPIALENDANAAAWGEALAGGAAGYKNAILITLGTGIGGGIIVGGRIYTGSNGVAGEIGHMVVEKNGRPCGCGRHGCWERYASASGLIISTREAMAEHRESSMWSICENLADVNGKTAFDGARSGDKTATIVVSDYISYLACGLTNLVNIFEPEAICIGGGISAEGETLLAPLREIISREEYRHNLRHTEIKAALLGNDAGLIGAAMLDRQ